MVRIDTPGEEYSTAIRNAANLQHSFCVICSDVHEVRTFLVAPIAHYSVSEAYINSVIFCFAEVSTVFLLRCQNAILYSTLSEWRLFDCNIVNERSHIM